MFGWSLVTPQTPLEFLGYFRSKGYEADRGVAPGPTMAWGAHLPRPLTDPKNGLKTDFGLRMRVEFEACVTTQNFSAGL